MSGVFVCAADSESVLTTASVLVNMQRRLDSLPQGREFMAEFLSTYQRTTVAVAHAVRASVFEDPEWVEALVVAFAELYLNALDADLNGTNVPQPWRLAFDAPASSHPLVHVLLGINAHINNDLPRALLAVIPDEDFEDTALLRLRRRDHDRIDGILRSRVAAEDNHLTRRSRRTLLNRAFTPLHRWSSQRFLRGARREVWRNTLALQRARLAGPASLTVRLAELEGLSAARVADLRQPQHALLRLSLSGFGVTLAPAGDA